MTEDKNVSDLDKASQDENAKSDDAETQPAGEVDVKGKASVGAREDDAPKPVDYEKKFKSVAGKMSNVEKERNEYAQKAAAYDSLDSLATRNKTFKKAYYNALVEDGAIKKEEVPEGVLDETKTETKGPKPKLTDEQNYLLNKVKEMDARETHRQITAVDAFEEKHPELLEGTQEEISARRKKMASFVKPLVGEGIPFEEALSKAYVARTAVDDPDKLKKDAELENLAKQQKTRSNISGGAGESPKSTPGVKLTDEQRSAAKEIGMTEEKYSEYISKESIDD